MVQEQGRPGGDAGPGAASRGGAGGGGGWEAPGASRDLGDVAGPQFGAPGGPHRRAPTCSALSPWSVGWGRSACGRGDTDARPAGRGEPGVGARPREPRGPRLPRRLLIRTHRRRVPGRRRKRPSPPRYSRKEGPCHQPPGYPHLGISVLLALRLPGLDLLPPPQTHTGMPPPPLHLGHMCCL